MIGEIFLSIIGIIVSVVLFLVGYQKTIGAKKERIKSANKEIEKILVRRIVLESFQPKKIDVTRLIDGKSRDFQVNANDLLSVDQLLNNIFTRIIESDFIPKDQRTEIYTQLVPLFKSIESEPFDFMLYEGISSNMKRKQWLTLLLMTALAMVTSVSGALVVTIPELGGLDFNNGELMPLGLGTAAASMVVIIMIMTINRLKELQSSTESRYETKSSYIDLEKEIVNLVEKYGFKTKYPSKKDENYDFEICKNNQKIIIEVKAWKKAVHPGILSGITNMLEVIAESKGANFAVVVTPNKLKVPESLRNNEKVKFMSVKQLKNFLSHKK